MKEVLDAIQTRLKAPVFGYFIIAFIVCNWDSFFYLFFANTDAGFRILYFNNQTNYKSLLLYPLLAAALGAIFYPWINLLFIWISQKPIEFKQMLGLISRNKLLIKEKELEEARTKLLATKENELIRRAKTDETIESISDEKLKADLKKQIDDLRDELSKNDKVQNNSDANMTNKGLYMQLAKLYEKDGQIERARQILEEAIARFG